MKKSVIFILSFFACLSCFAQSMEKLYYEHTPDIGGDAVIKLAIPKTIISGFDAKYLAWKDTWSRSEFAYVINPYLFAQSSEYDDLLNYCRKYGKAIWPLLIDKLTQEGVFIVSLLNDMTFNGSPQDFEKHIMSSSISVKTHKPFLTLYSILVDYCKELLADEDMNIQKSIREISTPEDEKIADTLYSMSGKVKYDIDGNATLIPPEEFIFTGDGIQSYNLTTKEIVFTDSVYNILLFNYHPIFNIYLNDKLLLENIVLVSSYSSMPRDDLVFFFTRESKVYLCYGSPVPFEDLPESYRKIRESYAEKRKEGWDIFIKYLSDAGKIVGNTDAIEPIIPPELNDISVYPNPTTGELRMENGELTIKDVHIFDIFGRKIINYQLSIVNSMDISHLPAGIYFVRITTEKGAVTKKVMKK